MQGTSNADQKLSRIIQTLTECRQDLTIKEIMDRFGAKSLPIAIIFFIAPFLQPVPLLGVSTPFGFLIGLCGVGIAFSAPVWLPQFISKTVVKEDWIVKIGRAAHYIITKVEAIAKPRAPHLVRATRFLSGLLLFLLGVFLALPLALPFSNFIPAVMIFILAIGLAEEDFVFIALGYILFIAGTIGLFMVADVIIKWIQEYL